MMTSLLEVSGVSQPGTVKDISFSLHAGEVLGISGLMGAGRSELARILFGDQARPLQLVPDQLPQILALLQRHRQISPGPVPRRHISQVCRA